MIPNGTTVQCQHGHLTREKSQQGMRNLQTGNLSAVKYLHRVSLPR